jgi:hypothetical protein
MDDASDEGAIVTGNGEDVKDTGQDPLEIVKR